MIDLVPLAPEHADALRRIHVTPEVARWWGEMDDAFPFDEPESTRFTIVVDGVIAGLIQYGEEDEPDYRPAWIDLFVDPALENVAAVRCYEKVGFRPVGVMRESERSPEGVWRDALLMELLARELS